MAFYSIEKIMTHGVFSSVKITLRDEFLGLYEVHTFATADHIYPFFGGKEIEIHTDYVRAKDGALYNCNDLFDFDGDIADTIFSPAVMLPRRETAEAVGAFFGIDTSGVVIGVDEKQLFRLKYERGYVWCSYAEDFVAEEMAAAEDIAWTKRHHATDWEDAPLYNPSEVY